MINLNLTNSTCLVIGTITFLKQFHADCRNQFIAFISQYIRSSINLSATQRPSDLPVDISKAITFLEDFISYSDLDRSIIEVYIPKFIMDQYVIANNKE